MSVTKLMVAAGMFTSLATAGLISSAPVFADVVSPRSASEWQVTVDFDQPDRPVPPYFASANINAPSRLLRYGSSFDDALHQLGIRFMRFQVPEGSGWDYRRIDEWSEEMFASLDAAVEAAHAKWGVEQIKFGIHRIRKPIADDGRFIEEDFDAYAEACAVLVRRYASPGDMRVRYWEPFNELDHQNHLEKMRPHGQDFRTVMELYRRCAERMKEVNPDIVVGGPALIIPDAPKSAVFLEYAGELAEFLSWHDYAAGSSKRSDARVLRSITEDDGRFLGGAKQLMEVMADADRADLPLFLNEFQVNWRAWDPEDARTINMFGGVFVASVLANLSATEVDALFIHDVLGRHYGLIAQRGHDRLNARDGFIYDGENDDALHIRPAAWVYKWFNELAGGNWVTCEVTLPPAHAASERGALLDAVAWRDGDRRVIMLVNKDERPHTVDINLGEPVSTDDFQMPIAVCTIAPGGPVEGRMAGTRANVLRHHLPAMSVSFLTYEQSASAVR